MKTITYTITDEKATSGADVLAAIDRTIEAHESAPHSHVYTSREDLADARAAVAALIGREAALVAERAALAAEVKALLADAERYRWLRDSEDVDTVAEIVENVPVEEWDAAIDAARASAATGGGNG